VNVAAPDLVIVAGDLTDDGYPDQYPLAAEELVALTCPRIVRVPGKRRTAILVTAIGSRLLSPGDPSSRPRAATPARLATQP
jgi:3',5'-cyclic AMP phosphodiesterase CpdA